MHNKQASCQQGFTLIEAMIVVAIVAILLSIAVPSFNDFFEKNRLKRAAEEVYGLLAKAKAETVVRNVDLSVSIKPAAPWCVGYAVTTVASDCCNAGACTVPVGDVAGIPVDVTQQIDGATFANVSITGTGAFLGGGGAAFNSVRGSAGAGSVVLTTPAGWGLNVVVSSKGRIRICGPNTNTMGYSAC